MPNKYILAVAALTLAACGPAVPLAEEGEDPFGRASSSISAADAGGEARTIDVTVTDWSFEPSTITVRQGEKVRLRLRGEKGIHSLLVADLGLNVRVAPGQETFVDVPTAKAGMFGGRCGVPCGPGHRDMNFTIVVE